MMVGQTRSEWISNYFVGGFDHTKLWIGRRGWGEGKISQGY